MPDRLPFPSFRAPFAEDDAAIAGALDQAWRDPPCLLGIFGAIDHKNIGLRYIVTGFAFFVAGGLLAVVMRSSRARTTRWSAPTSTTSSSRCTARR